MHPSQDLLCLLLTIFTLVQAEGDVVVCGGFIKSSAKIPFSDVKVGVFTTDGILKESTECAPHNGYFLLPLYSKGRVIISVIPPDGWTFQPDKIVLDIDGVTDSCSKGEDLNFVFQGFTVSGHVLSKGLEVGPTGVSATLTDQNSGAQQHVKTVTAGLFSIPNVLSGTYVISFSHPSWKMEEPSSVIVVQMENYVIAEPFIVLTYDASGSVQSSGQPIAGVEVYLTPISGDKSQAIDGCEMVNSELGLCKVISDTNGLYHFPALTPGKYQIVPHYQSEHSTFDVSPNQLVFNVATDTVLLDTAFTVNGFAVIGRVLNSLEGSMLAGVHIFVNGEKVAITNAEGMFELSNVTSGQYEVVAKLKGYYFETETRDISPNNPTLPDIVANAYQLCGTIYMSNPPASALPLGQRKVGLQPSGEGSNTAMVTTVTDPAGAFCFKVSPGIYVLQSLIGAAEYKDGLRLVPESAEVQITNYPLHGIEFHQLLGSLRGSVKCIIEDACSSITVHVTTPYLVKQSVQTENGLWSVSELLPAEYKVTVDYPHWCWKETEQTVTVTEASEAAPFVQSGYIMKVEVSHAALLNFSTPHLEEENVPNEENIGTFSLEAGTNRFCLKKPGVYDLVPFSCHKFQQTSYKYDTAQSNELVLTAKAHLLMGELHVLNIEGAVLVVLTNLDTHEKVTVETTVTDSVDKEGFILLTYQMWSIPGQKYQVKPLSADLLFTPATHTVAVSDTVCPTNVPVFHGRQGTFVSGSIAPPVRGVLITLTSPGEHDLKLTQITDEKGAYSIGPLHNNLEYKVRAEKQGYNIHSSGDGHDFTALKLSKLTVIIAEGGSPLGGVLVSVSGTQGYRNNVVLDDTPLVLTGLVPGEYFIRPILKEYKFTPSSKMLTVSEGLEIEVELNAERVAYSCYGYVTTLNGRPQPDVIVEAVGAGECGLLEEGVTGNDGEYRIRGLPPACPITVSVRSERTPNVRRASPPSRLVKGEGTDSTDVNFIVFHEPTLFDITGSVDISDEYISTTKVILVEEGAGNGKVLHTSALDDSRLFIFTDMDLKKSFTVKLESSLSPSMYSFKIPDVKIKSEGPFQHTDVAFTPIRKSLPQEQVTRASFTALAIIVLSMVLAANHATLVPVFTQVFHSVTNRNSVEMQVSSETNGMEYIDDIHRGIRRKSKKR